VRITSFALSPHERSVVVGLQSGAIRILVANEEHLLKKIETVLDQHFFGCVLQRVVCTLVFASP
jgi:hypothetical protein